MTIKRDSVPVCTQAEALATRHLQCWMIRLRWLAIIALISAAALLARPPFGGQAWRWVLTAAGFMTVFNGALLLQHRRGRGAFPGRGGWHIVVDLALLTLVLSACGGLRNPFSAYFVVHIALAALLARRAVLWSTVTTTLVALVWLSLCTWHPAWRLVPWQLQAPWGMPAALFAYASTALAVAYLAAQAGRVLCARDRALRQVRGRAALDLKVLAHTLEELSAGLQIVDAQGIVLWQNPLARHLCATPPVAEHLRKLTPEDGKAPAQTTRPGLAAAASSRPAPPLRQHVVVDLAGEERMFEVLVLRLRTSGHGMQGSMRLFIDRSQAWLAEQQLVLAERLASLGRVTQGVAHELNTPLATIATLAADMRQVLQCMPTQTEDAKRQQQDLDESATVIQAQTKHLGTITQALLTGSDLCTCAPSGPLQLGAVVERACALVFAGAGGRTRIHVAGDLCRWSLDVASSDLMQVLVNLLQNAHDAVAKQVGGRVRVHAETGDTGLQLIVEDNGPGIPQTLAPRVFTPFSTTKSASRGTGLGLYSSRTLVRRMGGQLTLERHENTFTRAVLHFPAQLWVEQRLAESATMAHAASL
ncbi:MAG: sensor histidine kinase [Polyangiales bacterium]